MTQEELKEELTEVLKNSKLCEQLMYIGSQKDFEWEDFSSIESLGINLEFVHHHGGMEQGRAYYSVIKFNAGDVSVLAKFNGDYASHYGTDYTHWSFVTPKKVEITEYV